MSRLGLGLTLGLLGFYEGSGSGDRSCARTSLRLTTWPNSYFVGVNTNVVNDVASPYTCKLDEVCVTTAPRVPFCAPFSLSLSQEV